MSRRYTAPGLERPQVSNLASVQKWIDKVTGLLSVREGMLGDELDQVVTFRDMFEAGLTKEYINGVYQAWGGTNSTGTIPSTADGPANYDIPPTPTGLVVASGIGVNILQWTNPASLYGNHAYTEVWRSATNDLGTAVKISTWTFHLAEDTLGTTNTTYYYWIRFVSKANKYSPYNAGATSGVAGTTAFVVYSDIFVTNLSAINADMGSITAGTITGGTIQTAASGARIVLNASDLIGYNSASVAKTTLSGSTGLLTAVDAVFANASVSGRVSASSFATSGSYLSAAASAADTTLNLYDTTDFATSGSGQIVDSTNDRDAFSWTGKTATTLTGCSGVLAHPAGASVVSLATSTKSILINDETNEMRFYGDRGDGTIEELAAIGINTVGSDTVIASFGSISSGNSRGAAYARSDSGIALRGESVSNNAVYGNSTSGIAIQGVSVDNAGLSATSTNYLALEASSSSTTRGTFKITARINDTDPSAGTKGEFYVRSSGVLRFHDGTSWKTVTVV